MTKNLIILKKDSISVGILPHIGGRIVSLNVNNGQNILSSNSDLWNFKFNKPIKEYTSDDLIQFRGHTTWVGPQSEWWIHQNINTILRDNKTNWPPDPFLIYGNFKILQQNKNSILLQGPKSPYTGVQITKSYTILSDHKIEIKAIAKNIRNQTVAWDLWFNTRLDGMCKFYVPVTKNGINKIVTQNGDEKVNHKLFNGYFTFIPSQPSHQFEMRSAKAFLTPRLPYIFAFNKGYLFIIHININNPKLIHHEQGMVEIYNAITHSKDEALLELEYHGPYKKLKPSETMEITEIWELVKYDNDNTETAHIKFIDEYLSTQFQ